MTGSLRLLRTIGVPLTRLQLTSTMYYCVPHAKSALQIVGQRGTKKLVLRFHWLCSSTLRSGRECTQRFCVFSTFDKSDVLTGCHGPEQQNALTPLGCTQRHHLSLCRARCPQMTLAIYCKISSFITLSSRVLVGCTTSISQPTYLAPSPHCCSCC
jgi:hypothetical protein